MHSIVPRYSLVETVHNRLKTNPAVALLGARQVGKSTVAGMVLKDFPEAIYLDLERPKDLNKLDDPEAFFEQFSGRLICLDEIQRTPEIFSILRGVIDRNRKNGQFLIVGSASRDLIQQSSESLAGRLSFIEITPFKKQEVDFVTTNVFRLRGGYPRSILAEEEESVQWREDYIRTFLERDIPQLGFKIPANTLGRFWRMLAHCHGQVLNSSKLADSMGVSSHTIRKYIDLLTQTFVLRVLPPFSKNLKKRLIKSPKIYIRDSGLLHSLLGIDTMEDLFGHPVYGASYEGFVIENICSQFPRYQSSFLRTSNGAEIDLILTRGQKTIAVEIKSSTAPRISKGFWNCVDSIQPSSTHVIAPVDEPYPLTKEVMVTPLLNFLKTMAD